MKIAIVYNHDSQAIINLFGVPNREKYGLETIDRIKSALEAGGHQVQAFEGDKNIIHALEDFMPAVISGERPGLVFNLSYGIQGRARYTHIPGILEMLGIPYVGSGPETHAIALDKVLTKMVMLQKGLPTPKFAVLETPDFQFPLPEGLKFPLIVKPKDEAVSMGLRIVRNADELREGVRTIYETMGAVTLVEEYIEGREINVGLLGNSPVEALPPVEVIFERGEAIFTHEDKVGQSTDRIKKVCPADLSPDQIAQVQKLAVQAFKALGCFDSARVDFRLDRAGNPYILEINSMASLGPGGSYVMAAAQKGLDYTALTNRLIEIASQRYFGPLIPEAGKLDQVSDVRQSAFTYLVQNRDYLEEELKVWTNLQSRTGDPTGLGTVLRKFEAEMKLLDMESNAQFTNRQSAWTWQTRSGLAGGTLLVLCIDVPREINSLQVPFRREPEWLYGEGVASSRAGLTGVLFALKTLLSTDSLHEKPVGVFVYTDEGRGMRYSSSLLQQAACQAARVIVFQPGFQGGKIVDQRRGLRKFSILVEGASRRIGYRRGAEDIMSWFLKRATELGTLSQPNQQLSLAVQDVQSERYSVLLPHRIRTTVYITYLCSELADAAEAEIRRLFTSPADELSETVCYVEKLEERPALNRSLVNQDLLSLLKRISFEWKLPFGTESGLLPSAAGVIPPEVPVVCGFGPASRDLFTPDECVHRGELLQRTLLLTLALLSV
ncbi:MAG: M20/M25/M40 family metallo-hydrolase [Firmicutes bacterium]|nr:M20/M25/M40 family metallo-hydrolase [Bacillota bacterium]